MKKLGIVGGTSPESTVDYYRSLVARYRERVGDGSYPRIIINSVDLQSVVNAFSTGDHARLTADFVDGVECLARAGADFGLFAANTPHLVFDEVARRSRIPLISIVEVACKAAKPTARKRLAILSNRFTMKGTFYADVFTRHGIALVVPQPEDLEWVHEKYMGELINGMFLPETHAQLLAVVDRMREQDNVDGVILAGTELSLIIKEESHNGIPILDTAKIHVEAAIDEMLRP